MSATPTPTSTPTPILGQHEDDNLLLDIGGDGGGEPQYSDTESEGDGEESDEVCCQSKVNI